jgi:sugar phosphate isomerase/epimerase
MGTRLVTLCTGTRDPHDRWRSHPDNATPEAWHQLLRSLEAAIGIADRHDVDLGVEPEQANVVDSAAKAERLVAEMASARVRIVLDPANLVEGASAEEQRRIVADAVERLADRIVMAHAKDRVADGRVVAAGSGVIDFPHFLRRLNAIGFVGPLVTHGLDAAEAPAARRFLAQTLAAVGT